MRYRPSIEAKPDWPTAKLSIEAKPDRPTVAPAAVLSIEAQSDAYPRPTKSLGQFRRVNEPGVRKLFWSLVIKMAT